jgi:hypothetical protein
MMEFGVDVNQEDGPVVCKIYKTPRAPTAGCSARKKRKATDPAAQSARGKKRKAKDEERSDPAAPSARVRRRLNFPSSPAILEDRQHSEPEERAPAFDPISFLADGHALPALNCYQTPDLGDWPIAPKNSGSWTTAAPSLSGMELFQSFLMPVDTRPKESTSAGDWSFSLNDHADFAPSCPDIALLPTGADWASPAASEQFGGISYGSCTSGVEFRASLPVSRFEGDMSIYWSPEPSSAPTASSAALIPLGCSGAEWASSPMLLPLQGWRNPLC